MSKKGSTWKNHKYIRIENGRYIYSEGKGNGSGGFSYGKGTSKSRAATLNEMHEFLSKIKLTKSGKGSSSKSSSKKSGSSSEKKGSGSSKEKTEKTSSEKEVKDVNKAGGSDAYEEKRYVKVDDLYTEVLENQRKKNNRSQLPRIRKAQQAIESKKKFRHGEIMEYDYVITKPELNEDTLAHYGVMGMKWGIRKNPSKAFDRASRQADRNRTRRIKKGVRSQYRAQKASKKLYKKTRALEKAGRNPMTSNETMGKRARSVTKALKKYNRAQRQVSNYQKMSKRENDYINKMENVFSNVKLKDVSNDVRKKHRRYEYMLSK